MAPSSPSSRLRRRARGLLSLSVLGLSAVPLIGWSNVVEVAVDGEVVSHRTYATTVGEVLEQLEVPVGPADQVTPAPEAPLDEVETIDVERAITVDVVADGSLVRRVTAPADDVASMLDAADMDVRDEGARVAPAWRAPVGDGDTIHVVLPRPVRLTVDGTTHEVQTLQRTPASVLREAGIELGPDDVVDWDLEAELYPHAEIVVERVAFETVREETPLPHEQVRRETEDLRKGITRVEVEGQDGVQVDTYRVQLVDGEEVDRELVDSQVEREPRDEVVLVGTFVPPPPPKPAPAARASSGDPGGDVWDRLARCESGGNWSANGRYHGGLQFHPATWRANKPSGAPEYAYQASREQQIAAGRNVQRSQGWSAWPHCADRLGLR